MSSAPTAAPPQPRSLRLLHTAVALQALLLVGHAGAERGEPSVGNASLPQGVASQPSNDSGYEPLSGGRLSANINQLENQNAELSKELDQLYKQLLDLRMVKERLQDKLRNETAVLKSLTTQKEETEGKIDKAEGQMVKISAQYESQVHAAEAALACLSGTCNPERELRNGDMVYMGCDIQNLEDVNTALRNSFHVQTLTSILLGADDGQKAAAFHWDIQMEQDVAEERKVSMPDLEKYQGGKYKHDKKAYCASVRSRECDPSSPKRLWSKQSEPAGPTAPPAEPAKPAKPTPSDECKGLTHAKCSEKGEECTWVWRCHEIAEQDKCLALGPTECQWKDTLTEACNYRHCCATEKSWTVACQPKPKSLHEEAAAERVTLLRERQDDMGEQLDEAPDSEAGGLRGNLSAARRLSPGSCVFTYCKFSRAWANERKGSPASWEFLPKGTRSVTFANPPAYNVKDLSSEQYSSDKVRLGARAGEGFGLGELSAKVFPTSGFVPVKLKPHTPFEKMTSTVKVDTYSLKSDQSVLVRMTELLRDQPASTWTDKNSWANVAGKCEENCICNNDENLPSPDLRACFHRSPTQRLSVLAKAMKQTDGSWALAANKDTGLLLKLNSVVPPEDLIQTGRDSASTLLKVLRVILPLLMWLGFYCCLSPITWVINEFQEVLEYVPCVGEFLGALAGCLETLMDCAICAVSCCGALSCSLLIASVAWVWFRPLVGIPMLLASVLLFLGLGYFAMARQGAPKVRRSSSRRSSAREVCEAGSSVELQPAQAPAQFAVVCPQNVGPGSTLQVQAPDGRLLQVQVPQDVWPGQQFLVAG